MASSVTLAQGNAAFAAVLSTYDCAYCQSPIVPGERWVREKIHEPFDRHEARYRRYHADLFGEEVLSCWEKHQMQQETRKREGCPA